MNIHDIELPPEFQSGNSVPVERATITRERMTEILKDAIEADRKRRQSEAEEVCAEAYQVVGSLLSDLGIFETEHAEKILDNLSRARMVHKDVLPWPAFGRQRRGEPVAWAMFADNGNIRIWARKPMSHPDCVPLYTAPQPAEPVEVPSDDDIRRVARDMYLAGDLAWLGFDKDENGEYTQPKISSANITLIRALLARYGSKTGEATKRSQI